jgi:Domain of unknown function
MKWIDTVSNNLIVVAVLISTIAFSAAFNVPGSYNDYGVANLRKHIQYYIFLVFDTVAMSTSTSAAMLLVVAKAVSKKVSWIIFSKSLILLWVSLFSMELAFLMAVSVSLGNGNGRTAVKSIITFISIYFFSMTASIMHEICSPAKLAITKKFLSTHQIDIQFPVLASYARRSRRFLLLNIFFYVATLVILWTVPFLEAFV